MKRDKKISELGSSTKTFDLHIELHNTCSRYFENKPSDTFQNFAKKDLFVRNLDVHAHAQRSGHDFFAFSRVYTDSSTEIVPTTYDYE